MKFAIKVSEGRGGEEEGEGRKKRKRNRQRVGGTKKAGGGGRKFRRMFSSIPDLCPLDINTTPCPHLPGYDNQKYLQTLLNVPWDKLIPG